MRLRLIGWLVVAAVTPAGTATARSAPGSQAFFSGTLDLAHTLESFLRSYLRFDVFYHVEAWHPDYGDQERDVSVPWPACRPHRAPTSTCCWPSRS